MTDNNWYFDVILPIAIPTPYTYRYPQKTDSSRIGCRVLVPVANKKYIGLVYKVYEHEDNFPYSIKDVLEIIDETPIIFSWQLPLWEWVADYYMCSLSDVMVAALPSFFFKEKEKKFHPPLLNNGSFSKLNDLNEIQQRTMLQIEQAWEEKNIVLLHGVTASGKTEIYLHFIVKKLLEGKQVLYLVPEISLTSQLTNRLKVVLGDYLYIYHSLVTLRQRRQIYNLLLNNQPCVILGTRSAVFLPLNLLNLIIIDEEHDVSYKQISPVPHYNARSVALMFSTFKNVKILLGSATPSIETYHNAQINKYGFVELKERYSGFRPPKITLIDLKRQYTRKEMYDHFSDPLVDKIRELLNKKKQIILFQNRRGYAPQVICKNCGTVILCPQCNVAMTLHINKGNPYFECHYCGCKKNTINICPQCGGDLKQLGMGTEKIEEEAIKLFPDAVVQRMDWDTTRKKNAIENIISDFSNHRIDILLGTQMITQGLDFDNVGLVAILNADNLLSQPTFRSHEYAYQRLEQVAGRAGRKTEQGEVFIQTWIPDNPIFDFVKEHNYLRFYNNQIEERLHFKYPPFFRLILITTQYQKEEILYNVTQILHERLVKVFGDNCSSVITPVINKIEGSFLLQIRIRIKNNGNLPKAKNIIQQNINYVKSKNKNVHVSIDVDPV